jgi:FtsH-binding integral membrane protein
MHCVLLVIALAVYVMVLHLGMVIQASSERHRHLDDDVRKSYTTAMVVAYVLSAIVTVMFCAYRRDKKHLVSYWATAVIIFFGGSYAIYRAFPKKVNIYASAYHIRSNRANATGKIHMFALFASLITYCMAKLTLSST